MVPPKSPSSKDAGSDDSGGSTEANGKDTGCLPLPSLRQDGASANSGSVGHPDECTPCAFYCFSLRGCRNGHDCSYCHQYHESKLRQRREEWKRVQREKRGCQREKKTQRLKDEATTPCQGESLEPEAAQPAPEVPPARAPVEAEPADDRCGRAAVRLTGEQEEKDRGSGKSAAACGSANSEATNTSRAPATPASQNPSSCAASLAHPVLSLAAALGAGYSQEALGASPVLPSGSAVSPMAGKPAASPKQSAALRLPLMQHQQPSLPQLRQVQPPQAHLEQQPQQELELLMQHFQALLILQQQLKQLWDKYPVDSLPSSPQSQGSWGHPLAERLPGKPDSGIEMFRYTPNNVAVATGQPVRLWPPVKLMTAGMYFAISPPLPAGLVLDERMGTISGRVQESMDRAETYFVTAVTVGDETFEVKLSSVTLRAMSPNKGSAGRACKVFESKLAACGVPPLSSGKATVGLAT